MSAANTNTQEPLLQRYSVGNCEMLPRAGGWYVEAAEVRRLLNLITEDDNSVVMLARINHLIRDLS